MSTVVTMEIPDPDRRRQSVREGYRMSNSTVTAIDSTVKQTGMYTRLILIIHCSSHADNESSGRIISPRIIQTR